MNEDANSTAIVAPIQAQGVPLVGTQLRELVPAPRPTPLPVALPVSKPKRARWRWRRLALALAAVLGLAGGAFYVCRQSQSQLPPGIAFGDGRIEADEIDIDTKFAGRIAEMLADEGDMVRASQVVSRMDTRDLEASLRKSESQVQQAQQSLDEARANVVQQTTQVTLAQQQFDRTNTLVAHGFATNEPLDQRRQALNSAIAALNAAKDRVGEADRPIDAATHDAELYKINISDNTLVAPRDGRIQYRIANIGEVLPAGGRVFTMLDTAQVYMDIYLPTSEAGKVKIGADARILLDAVAGSAQGQLSGPAPGRAALCHGDGGLWHVDIGIHEHPDRGSFRHSHTDVRVGDAVLWHDDPGFLAGRIRADCRACVSDDVLRANQRRRLHQGSGFFDLGANLVALTIFIPILTGLNLMLLRKQER